MYYLFLWTIPIAIYISKQSKVATSRGNRIQAWKGIMCVEKASMLFGHGKIMGGI